MQHGRRWVWQVSMLAILVVGPALADDLPLRKAGLWKMTMTESTGESVASQQCVDEASDRALQKLGQGMAGTTCSKHEIKKGGAGWTVASECTFGESKMISKGEFKGDFQTSYEGQLETTFTPAFMGQTQSKSTIRGEFLGPCTAGQKPGDIIMDGHTMNVHELGKAMPK